MNKRRSLHWASPAGLGIFILLVCVSLCHARRNDLEPAAVMYYRDAEGVFTIDPPLATIGHLLPLSGTCGMPEIMLKIEKRGGPSRSATLRLGGSPSFRVSYVIKDGPGEYDVVIFGKRTVNALTGVGLCRFTVQSAAPLPEGFRGLFLNDAVLSFVKASMGTTVSRGECWDLVQEALDRSGADWNRPFEFGRPLDPSRDRIEPGDIIQFRSVTIVERFSDGRIRRQTIGNPDHTAVILGVEGPRHFTLAHQNIDGKRFVTATTVDLRAVTGGTYRIYRPLAGFMK